MHLVQDALGGWEQVGKTKLQVPEFFAWIIIVPIS